MASAHPVQIYKHIGNRRTLDVRAVEQIIDPVRNLPIGIVSVNGIKRSGKSFLLNFFLKYLESTDKSNWFPSNGNLNGFRWRGGQRRETVGIWMLSKPFIVRNPTTGEQMAVIVMDTQGSFDAQTSFGENALLFAISVWLSSLFIFNEKGDFTEDKLQFLEYFSDFSNQITQYNEAGQDGGAMFQHLLLLIRDWVCPGDYGYGWHNVTSPTGKNYTRDFTCSTSNDYQEDNIRTRIEIVAKFLETSSFLLPHPGLEVAGNETDNLPPLQKIQPNFLAQMKDFVPLIFERILQPRIVHGDVITGDLMMKIIEKWSSLIEKNEIPEVRTLSQAAAEAQLEMALNRVGKLYQAKLLEIACKGLSDMEFQRQTEQVQREVITKFKEIGKRYPNHAENYARELQERMQETLQTYVEYNRAKRVEKEHQVKIAKIEADTVKLQGTIQEYKSKIDHQEKELVNAKDMAAEDRRRLESELEATRQRFAALTEENERKHREYLQQVSNLQVQANKPPQVVYKRRGGLKGFVDAVVDVAGAVTGVLTSFRSFGSKK